MDFGFPGESSASNNFALNFRERSRRLRAPASGQLGFADLIAGMVQLFPSKKSKDKKNDAEHSSYRFAEPASDRSANSAEADQFGENDRQQNPIRFFHKVVRSKLAQSGRVHFPKVGRRFAAIDRTLRGAGAERGARPTQSNLPG